MREKVVTLLFLFTCFLGFGQLPRCVDAYPLCIGPNQYPLGYDFDTTIIPPSIDLSQLNDTINLHWFKFVVENAGLGPVFLNITSANESLIEVLPFGPVPAGSLLCNNPTPMSPLLSIDITSQTIVYPGPFEVGDQFLVLVANVADGSNFVRFELEPNDVGIFCPFTTNPSSPCNTQTPQSILHINSTGTVAQYPLVTDPYKLCIRDTLNIEYLPGSGQYPDQVPVVDAQIPYRPGSKFFVYFDEPDSILPPSLDPALIYTIEGSEYDLNYVHLPGDLLALLNAFPALQNTIYIKAFPAYNVDSSFVAPWCYDYSSPVYKLQLFNPIRFNFVQGTYSCSPPQSDFYLTGGAAEFVGGSTYTIDNILPSGVTFAPSSGISHHDTALVNNLPTVHSPFSFRVNDGYCENNIQRFFGAPEPDFFSYDDTLYCKNHGLVLPQINIIQNLEINLAISSGTGGILNITSLGVVNTTLSDAAKYDITVIGTHLGCTTQVDTFMWIRDVPVLDQAADTFICPGEELDIPLVPNLASGQRLYWRNSNPLFGLVELDSTTSVYLERTNNSTYDDLTTSISYWIEDLYCSSDTLDFDITIHSSASAGDDILACQGDVVQLEAQNSTVVEWGNQMLLDDYNIPDPDLTVAESGYISVLLTTAEGCEIQDTLVVQVAPISECTDEESTTAFSPNNDGVNDFWVIPNIELYENNKVMIFNRWGDLVNSYNGYDNVDVAWDGRGKGGSDLPSATYFYVVESTNNPAFKGWVQLVR